MSLNAPNSSEDDITMLQKIQAVSESDSAAIKALVPSLHDLYKKTRKLEGAEVVADEIPELRQAIFRSIDTCLSSSLIDGEEMLSGIAGRLKVIEQRAHNTIIALQSCHYLSSLLLSGRGFKMLDFILHPNFRKEKAKMIEKIGQENTDTVLDAWFIENKALFL